METVKGLQTRVIDGKRTEHMIATTVSNKVFMNTVERIYGDSAKIIDRFKNEIQLRHFNLSIFEGQFSNFLKYPMDQLTCERIHNASPSMYLKLLFNANTCEQTVFTDREGTIIPWHELEQTAFTFIPKIHIKNIYVGSRYSFRIEVPSATVTSFSSKNVTDPHKVTRDVIHLSRAIEQSKLKIA
jgi:hypothetical protein